MNDFTRWGKGVSHRRKIDDMKFGDQGNNPKNDDVIYEETASYQRQKITLLVSFLKCDPQKQCKNCGCCQTNA